MAEYVAWALRAFSHDILHTCSKQGTTVNSVETSKLLGFEIPVAPRGQQAKIVAEIEKQFSRLDEAVANLKRVKANLKRYKAAVLKAAIEGKLTEDCRKHHPNVEPASKLLQRILVERRAKRKGNGTYKEPATAITSNLPVLPDSWVWCITDALFSYVTSGSRGWAQHYSVEGPLFLRIGNLDHDSIRLDLKDIQRVKPPAGAEGTRTKVKSGDILVSITADVGMIAVAPLSLEEAYINQHVALARPVSGICREYLAWYLAARDGGQKEFRRLQRGATKVGLGLDDIRAVPVPLPPIVEQQQIVAEVERRLSVIEQLEATVEASRTRADRLRQSVLARAFSGELTTLQ
jgi:type I restriction enzyme S subunit